MVSFSTQVQFISGPLPTGLFLLFHSGAQVKVKLSLSAYPFISSYGIKNPFSDYVFSLKVYAIMSPAHSVILQLQTVKEVMTLLPNSRKTTIIDNNVKQS